MVNLIELAMRIKAARKEKNMTLDDVAARSGVAKGIISKVENFRVTPSLPSVVKIAAALDYPLEQLFEGLDNKPETCLVRKSALKKIERDSGHSNINYFDLAHLRPNRRMDPLELNIPVGGGREEPMSHEGEEFLHVLQGEITLRLDGEVHKLAEGDSMYFDAEVPHCAQNAGDTEARVLCVFLKRN